jgi:CheY-like chemotaxis protein
VACRAAVLVVEDDDALRAALAEAFERVCGSVMVARNGSEALEIISAGLRPGVILTDIDMPAMGGLELIAALAAADLGHIPVVTMSGTAQDTTNGGVHLMKPFELGDVIAAVGTCAGEPCALDGPDDTVSRRRKHGEAPAPGVVAV